MVIFLIFTTDVKYLIIKLMNRVGVGVFFRCVEAFQDLFR